MASLQKYKVGGKTYWRIVESRRVNGKPRAIPVLQLGTAQSLLEKLTKVGAGVSGFSVKSFEHGAIAALLEIAKELDLVEIINRHAPKEKGGVSTGLAILFIVLNRLIDPCSKNSWSDWAKRTSLFRFYPSIPFSKLSSQFFWEHMQRISEDSLRNIEDELISSIIKKYDLNLDLLFFDTTNCYSYVEDRNDPEWLFQYGHSKEKQSNKRIFGVELLVTKDSHIPIYHNTYPGNVHDSKLFPNAVSRLSSRLKRSGISPSTLTLVFDRGSLSKENFALIDKNELGFVTALRLGDIPREMFNIQLQRFSRIKEGQHKGMSFKAQEIDLWGAQRKIVFYISKQAKEYQTRLLNNQIERSLAELSDWNSAIVNQTTEHHIDDIKIKKKIEDLRRSPYLKDILEISYDSSKPKDSRLQFSVNHKAKEDIIIKYFGKRALVTNRIKWSASEIINAYFSQYIVEHAFRSSKDRHHISLRPQFHWTNQSLRVHVFTCFLALLMGQLLFKKARLLNFKCSSLPQILEDLSSVRIAAFLKKGNSSLSNPTVEWKIEKTENSISKLFSALS